MAERSESSESPFQTGRRLNSRELVDRRAELRTVRTALVGGGKLFVIGPRRHGKTSILNVARRAAERQGVVVLSFDAEAFTSTEQLATAMLAEATRRLEPAIKRAQQAVSRFFGRLRPTVTFNPADQSISASLAVETAAVGGPLPLLTTVLDGIDKWAAHAKRPVAIIIDEVQELLEKEGEQAERQFRAAVQKHEHVAYVFAGSKTHYLARLTSDPAAPFFNLGSRLHVGAIPDSDFRKFLESAFASGGFQMDPSAVDAILSIAERVPWNVQLLADACWSELTQADVARPWTEAEIKRTADDMVRRLDPIYSPQWLNLSGPQRTALMSAVHDGTTGLTSQARLRRYQMTASGMQRAVGGLIEKGVLFEEATGGRATVRLQDPFFGVWVRLFVVPPG